MRVLIPLAAMLLLLVLTLASVMMLTPEAVEGRCSRPELVPPAECGPF